MTADADSLLSQDLTAIWLSQFLSSESVSTGA